MFCLVRFLLSIFLAFTFFFCIFSTDFWLNVYHRDILSPFWLVLCNVLSLVISLNSLFLSLFAISSCLLVVSTLLLFFDFSPTCSSLLLRFFFLFSFAISFSNSLSCLSDKDFFNGEPVISSDSCAVRFRPCWFLWDTWLSRIIMTLLSGVARINMLLKVA